MAGHAVSPVREGVVCLCLICYVMSFISVIAVEWAVPKVHQGGFEGIGLWRYCYRKGEPSGGSEVHYICTDTVGNPHTPAWFEAVQAMILLSMIFYGVAFIAIITFTCCASMRYDNRVMIVFLAMEVTAIIFNIIGFSIFAGRYHLAFTFWYGDLKLAWSFILSCVVSGVSFVAILLALLELYRSRAGVPMQRFDNELQPPLGRSSTPPVGPVSQDSSTTAKQDGHLDLHTIQLNDDSNA